MVESVLNFFQCRSVVAGASAGRPRGSRADVATVVGARVHRFSDVPFGGVIAELGFSGTP